jgi:hypothetical protein
MQVLNTWLQRQIAFCLVTFLVVQIGAAQTMVDARQDAASQPVAPAATAKARPQSAGAEKNNAVKPAPPPFFYPDSHSPQTPYPENPDSPGAAGAQVTGQNQKSAAPQSAQTIQQNSAPPPVGTAASPYEKPNGAPASRPAGAAIAPAKQRRIRTFSIRVALIVGAAVAIGVVTAASLSSPNRAN